jgi:endo-beta-N-acetylglucosaminidase D
MILGSWYGSYLVPMLEPLEPSDIILNDVNKKVMNYARILHGDKITWSCFDVSAAPQRVAMYGSDILINTSCEHMIDMKHVNTGNPNTFYVLQSCDNDNDPGHINVCRSTDELVEKSGLTDVKFSARYNLGHKNRFMVMGFKRR